jgi:hypothetical protein
MNRPGPRGSNAENDTNGRRFDDGTKSLIEIDTGLLREATNHPARFVARETTIGAKLMLEDPFT